MGKLVMLEMEEKNRVTRAAKQMIEIDRLLGVRRAPIAESCSLVGSASSEICSVDEVRETEKETEAMVEYAGNNPVRVEKAKRLAELCERHNRECPLVKTMPGYTNVVFGEGDPNARLMFIGEAPGADEDRLGRPFVGRAGKLLDKMIVAMGLKREEVYICNLLKVRPPNNATPTPEQVDQSSPFLVEQVGIVEPLVIVALGSPCAKFLLQTKEGITNLRGRWFTPGLLGMSSEINVMPTFHPAYLLRAYTPENRKKVWSDLCEVMERLGMQVPAAG